jgi:S1-C subfamily serine protease
MTQQDEHTRADWLLPTEPAGPAEPAAPGSPTGAPGPGAGGPWYPGPGWGAEQAYGQAPPPRTGRRTLVGAAALVLAGALAGGGLYGLATHDSSASPQTSATTAPTIPQPSAPDGSSGSTGDGSGGTSGQMPSSGLDVGVVDIVTTLGYQNGQAAGTGMVLTSDGEILTNNHVISGATDITVTYVATGQSYHATVVGYDAAHDVAVLQLQDASGLTPVTTSTSDVQPGDQVVAVGNAGGAGGAPDHASGTVTATGRSITATDESGGDAEQLSNLIETDAGIVAGDSGGPLYNAQGQVVGMDTAGSTTGAGFRFSQSTGTTDGYAIPIQDALDVVQQIESGDDSGTVHLGATGLMGVNLADSSGGVQVQGVVDGGAAADAGLVAGDTITAIDGHDVTAVADVRTVLLHSKPGQDVRVRYVDSSGSEHTTTVTLTEGPPL